MAHVAGKLLSSVSLARARDVSHCTARLDTRPGCVPLAIASVRRGSPACSGTAMDLLLTADASVCPRDTRRVPVGHGFAMNAS